MLQMLLGAEMAAAIFADVNVAESVSRTNDDAFLKNAVVPTGVECEGWRRLWF